MSPVYAEKSFEDNVVASMEAHGWSVGNDTDYHPELGLDTAQLFTFLGATQADEWEELVSRFGGSAPTAQAEFAKVLAKRIDTEGTLNILRRGVTVQGVRFRLAYFKPSHTIAEDALAEYRRNRLSVTRQLRYAARDGDRGKSVDLALFVNGIPVATAELKNPLTGQNVEDAKRQYIRDRDPLEPIFARRALAHFAVDPNLVFLTTRLAGTDTVFLPFNTGSEGPGQAGGAGNPSAVEGGYRTSYLWERVWQFDNWLDLLERFVHVAKRKDADGRKRNPIIFPRFHQWHAVRGLVDHAARHGAGHNYLVMHSAGSGKSNTIAWLAHRLASLHTPADPNQLDPAAVAAGLQPNTPVFDKTIIITDRAVLDRQLQDTVGDFSQTAGLVRNVGGKGGPKSAQLAEALSTSTARIIVVTLQTFPALLEYLRKEPTEIRGGKFAIVVDEAHSSQSGEAAKDVKKALRDLGLDADDDEPDPPESVAEALTESAAYRGRSSHLSYFAFTATPKHKTLNLFGTRDEVTGKLEPFHTYSMRQAIEEGFILDPLRNYTTYKTLYRLANHNPEDPEVDPAKAKSRLARFAYLHKSTLAQHAEIIIENFNRITAPQMGGRAKAMVVTRSREAAVRMYRAIRSYLADSGAPDPGVLVAFSGSLKLDGEDKEVTEAQLNGFSEGELPRRFAYTAADDRHATARTASGARREYRILIVAEKYQTGFDQPLLTTMFVEKPLAGVAAVQTLSRLNRIHPLKEQGHLFVLDLVNDAEDIQRAYLPYYERAVTGEADPDLLYALKHRVMSAPVLVESELSGFATAFFEIGEALERTKRHPELYRYIEPARERFAVLAASDEEDDRETAEEFRADLNEFVTKYRFLAQIMSFPDGELERLYLYGCYLLRELPARRDGGVDIGKVELSHLKVFKTGEHDLGLSGDGDRELPGFSAGGDPAGEPEKELLSEIIEIFNERFGRDLSEADRIMVEERLRTVMANSDVRVAALNNDEEAFRHKFDPAMRDAVMDRYESNVEFTERYFGEEEFQHSINRMMRRAAYRIIRREEGLDAA